MHNSTAKGLHGAGTVDEHIRALNARAWDVRKTNPDTAHQLATESASLSRKLLKEHPSSLLYKRELGIALLVLAGLSVRLSEYTTGNELGEEALLHFGDSEENRVWRIFALAITAGAKTSLGNTAQGLAMAFDGLALTEGVDDPEIRSMMLNVTGMVYWVMSDYPHALDFFLRSLAAIREATNRRELIDVLNNLGMIYTVLGDYDKGLEYSNTALLIATEYGKRAGEGVALVNMGILHMHIDEVDKAREYFVRALALHRELGNKNGQMHTLINLAGLDIERGDLDQSDESVLAALELAQITGDRRIESYAMLLLGHLYSKRGDRNTAMEYYMSGLAIRREIGFRQGEVEALSTIGRTITELGSYDEAVSVLQEALDLAGQLQAKPMMFRIHELLADAYELSGDTASALQHHRLFYQLQKEFFNEQAVIRQKSLQVFYEVQQATNETEIYRQKNAELDAANAEILRQKQDLEEQTHIIRRAHDELLEKSLALEEMNRDKDEFIGIAVHGLKNPLALIIMAASMLRKNSERMSKTELDRNLEWIEISAWRMEEIVIKLLQSNAIESGKTLYEPEKFDIVPLLSPVVAEYTRRAAAKDIQLVADGLTDVIIAFADRGMTRDIADNLISNAVKFSPSGTTIHVSISAPASGDTSPAIRIVVQDEGPGINDGDKQRMFGKFERLSAKPTGGEHSTGLGLSIVKKLTDIMGGKIWCESTVGEGATFFVELPAAGVQQE